MSDWSCLSPDPSTQEPETWQARMKTDGLVVGGGPAGLSAALILGRCHRKVLVCDGGNPRNLASHSIHGLLGREGIAPSAFLHEARRDLARYTSVSIRQTQVTVINPAENGFEGAACYRHRGYTPQPGWYRGPLWRFGPSLLVLRWIRILRQAGGRIRQRG
jgi:hypothetical protein